MSNRVKHKEQNRNAQNMRRYLLCLALALTGCATGLNNDGNATNFAIAVHSASDNTKNHAANTAFSVSASCNSGEQMVGGGYGLLNNNSSPTLVAVEGNYPSAKNTWTVQVRNPDNPIVYRGDADVAILALVYCVTTANYDLSTEIQSQTRAIPRTVNADYDIDARCSQTGAMALSGGFLTTTLPSFNEPGGAVHQTYWPGLMGTGLTSSEVRFPDSTNSAMGWHVTQRYTPANAPTAPQPQVTTTVFALCAKNGISAQAYRLATVNAILSEQAPLNPACQVGEFTVGGGYNGAKVTGGVTSASLAVHTPFSFNAWQISGDSVNTPLTANALCVRIPSI